MNLTKEISKLQSYELCSAYEEIVIWQKTGILKDGLIREYSEKFGRSMKQDDSRFLMLKE